MLCSLKSRISVSETELPSSLFLWKGINTLSLFNLWNERLYELNEMYLLKNWIFCLTVISYVFISNRHVITILPTVPWGIMFNFCSINYLHCFCPHGTQLSYKYTSTYVLTMCSDICSKGKEREQETRFDTDNAAICRMNSEPSCWSFWFGLPPVSFSVATYWRNI